MLLHMPLSFTVNEVCSNRYEFSKQIFADWTTLNQILERYEELIRKRWKKKTQEQRRRILLMAWPRMVSTHRPEFKAFQRENGYEPGKTTNFPESFLWPDINLEDLVKWKPLILLLNSRGRHLPHVFAHVDYWSSLFSISSGAIAAPFVEKCSMILIGQTTPKDYGQVIIWRDDDDFIMPRFAFDVGAGLQVLKIQQRLLQFLVQCCHLILHDLPSDSWINARVQVHPEPLVMGDEGEWPSLASVAAEAPYRAPARLDFKRLQAVIAARHSAAEDHLWSLREDPSYFANAMFARGEHHRKMLEVDKNPEALFKRPKFWGVVLRDAILDVHACFISWDIVLDKFSILTALSDKYSTVLSPTRSLPLEFETEFHNLKFLLLRMIQNLIIGLYANFLASPPVRPFVKVEQEDPDLPNVIVRNAYHKDHTNLFWILRELAENSQQMLCSAHNLIDEFDRLTQSDRKQKEMVTPWVAQIYSELAVLIEVHHQLKLFHPSELSLDNGSHEELNIFIAHIATRMPSDTDLARIPILRLAELGDPSGRRFYYPSHKRRSQQTTEDMKAAEDHLDSFWWTVDRNLRDGAGNHIHEKLFPRGHEFERTLDWFDSSEDSEDTKEPEPSPQPHVSFFTSTVSDLVRNGRTFLQGAPSPSSKSKTRGIAYPPGPSYLVPGTNPPQPDAPLTFSVDNRSLRVFSALFHTVSQSDCPKEILWLDFLHAMAAVGFALEKLYGSTWQLTPTMFESEHNFQVHEPHPGNKIPFPMAREIGRRLNRQYGWTGGMFTLK